MVGPVGKALVAAFAGLAVVVLVAGCDNGGSGDGGTAPLSDSATPTVTASPSTGTPQPVPVGEALQTLSEPPERSLWALSTDSCDAGVEIAVEFEPYGVGPSSLGSSIVALVSDATPGSVDARVPALKGRNVVLILGQVSVTSGGRYSGTVITRKQGDRIVLVLQDVSRTSEP